MSPIDPPVLETPRLIMDAHRADDLDAVTAMWSSPSDMPGLSLSAPTRHQCWMRILQYRGLWPVLGFGYWAVREKATGRFIGDVGFADFHRHIELSVDGIPEAGWRFAEDAQGKGYAREAVAAALLWLDEQPHFAQSICLIAPDNERSLRLAERHGYLQSAWISLNGKDTILLNRSQPATSLEGIRESAAAFTATLSPNRQSYLSSSAESSGTNLNKSPTTP